MGDFGIVARVASLLLCFGVIGLSAKQWTKEDIPNPRQNITACKLEEYSVSSLHVCNPDGVLSDAWVSDLHTMIQHIRDNGNCPCTRDKDGGICLVDRLIRQGKPRSYHFTIVAIEEMAGSYVANSVEKAEEYAKYLRKTGGYGSRQYQMCGEDILIFLSLVDQVIYVVTGPEANLKLPDDSISQLITDSYPAFKNGLVDGLKDIITKMEKMLINP